MDPRVRSSPYVEPPENEVKLSWSERFTIRRRRVFFIIIHLMALLGLYYCLTGRVRVYTILWSNYYLFVYLALSIRLDEY